MPGGTRVVGREKDVLEPGTRAQQIMHMFCCCHGSASYEVETTNLVVAFLAGVGSVKGEDVFVACCNGLLFGSDHLLLHLYKSDSRAHGNTKPDRVQAPTCVEGERVFVSEYVHKTGGIQVMMKMRRSLAVILPPTVRLLGQQDCEHGLVAAGRRLYLFALFDLALFLRLAPALLNFEAFACGQQDKKKKKKGDKTRDKHHTVTSSGGSSSMQALVYAG